MILLGSSRRLHKFWSGIAVSFAFGLACLFAPSTARSEEYTLLAPIIEVGDYTHVFLSESIESTAVWLDTFLGGEEAYEGNTGSLIQMGTKTVVSQYGGFKSESSVRARLVLPRTQERLNLVLQSDAEESAESNDTTLVNDLIPVEKVAGFGAALEGIIVETNQWRAALRTGVRTRIPPDAFLRFDLRRRWLPGAGRITFDEKLYWYAVAGFANKVRLYWDLPGENGLFFRPSAGTSWSEDEPGYRWDGGLGFYQRVSEANILSYDARLSGDKGRGSPRTTAYTVMAELRHKLYKNWVYLGVGPGISWKKELDYRPEAFLVARFDLIFSKKLSDEANGAGAEGEVPSPSPSE